MERTGKIRRIDELGRIVIPVEVRRSMGLREGDPMEIYTEGDCVLFKRYSYGEKIADSLRRQLRFVKDSADQWEISRDTANTIAGFLEGAINAAERDGKDG